MPLNTMLRDELDVATPGRGFVELTGSVRAMVSHSGLEFGMAYVFTRHTSCSLLITENADPQVRADLERYFSRLVPDGDPLFLHDAEGPDDMPAHVRAALTGASLSIPFSGGELDLGTWQGIYLWEHRQRPHQRQVVVTLTGYRAPEPRNDNQAG
ncbi:secondary thiamine-phosphate synthase [Bordetella bronchialis]|uniref:Secondary thiamine-phosphate synthase n=2 Tax=Bordetella bronchialis TaxID=463025 RepID=A0A193G5M7_9BORD|nr:secondary thiamine-phosphate synthase [Bordetella bronchialis]ANN74761.1 secondary thiamine-phosphate synthase [Bordetella bronchialis]